MQTLYELGSCINQKHVLGIREEPRIVEQQFGNFQDVQKVKEAKAERHRFGQSVRAVTLHTHANVQKTGSLLSSRFRISEWLNALSRRHAFAHPPAGYVEVSADVTATQAVRHAPVLTQCMSTVCRKITATGRFFYRFPGGEAGLDVYNRATGKRQCNVHGAPCMRVQHSMRTQIGGFVTPLRLWGEAGCRASTASTPPGQLVGSPPVHVLITPIGRTPSGACADACFVTPIGRIPSGACADACFGHHAVRSQGFIGTLFRDLAQLRGTAAAPSTVDMADLNLVVVTHGLTLRLFLMRYFHLSVGQFEQSFNPGNAELVVMERRANADTGEEWYVLNDECAAALNMGHVDDKSINSHKSGGSKEDGSLQLGGSFEHLKASFIPVEAAGPGRHGLGGLC